MEDYFSFKGRICRRDYLTRNIPVVFFFLIFEPVATHTHSTFWLLLSAIVLITLAVIGTSLTIRRLHDMNLSGWLCLIGLILIVDFVWAIYVIVKDGTVGPNKYGEDPKERQAATA